MPEPEEEKRPTISIDLKGLLQPLLPYLLPFLLWQMFGRTDNSEALRVALVNAIARLDKVNETVSHGDNKQEAMGKTVEQRLDELDRKLDRLLQQQQGGKQ